MPASQVILCVAMPSVYDPVYLTHEFEGSLMTP